MNLAKEAYEAYANHTGWKSLATGQPLPQWDALPMEIQRAWRVSAAWVAGKVCRIQEKLCESRFVDSKPAETEIQADKVTWTELLAQDANPPILYGRPVKLETVVVLGTFERPMCPVLAWVEQSHRTDKWRWCLPNIQGASGECSTVSEAKEQAESAMRRLDLTLRCLR